MTWWQVAALGAFLGGILGALLEIKDKLEAIRLCLRRLEDRPVSNMQNDVAEGMAWALRKARNGSEL